MSARFVKLLLAWMALLVLLALELGGSYLPLPAAMRPLLLVVAVAMAGVIATAFMEVGEGPSVIRLFAAGGLLWLAILLVLGSLDPLTRFTYPSEADVSARAR